MPLSKKQAKQKGQNTGECTIFPLTFQNFHGRTPIPPFVGGGHPPPALSSTQLCLIWLRYTPLWGDV